MYIDLQKSGQAEFSLSNYDYKQAFIIEGFPMFGPIAPINILIGANNSGKSRLMRGIMKTSAFTYFNHKNFIIEIKNLELKFNNLLEQLLNHPGIIIKFPPTQINTAKHFSIDTEVHSFIIDSDNINQALTFNYTKLKSDSDELKALLFKELRYDIIKENIQKLINFLMLISKLTENFEVLTRDLNSIYQISIKCKDRPCLPQDALANLNSLISQLRIFSQPVIDNLKLGKKFYIPILRSASSLFTGPHADDIGPKYNQNILTTSSYANYKLAPGVLEKLVVISGDELYDKITDVRNNFYDIRQEFDGFEKFLSENFYNGKRVDIIARQKGYEYEKNILVKIGESEHAIHDLGDGIQSIIILMHTIFTAPKNSWVFIEEPELNLHPGFQRIFLDTIINNVTLKEKNLTIFLTTHSNHLIDLAVETESRVSIFSFRKTLDSEKPTFEINNLKRGDLKLLTDLGVNNSSVFMANCSIWVEGISDRIYISSFIKAYYANKGENPPIKEDINYSFFEYAGSNISHYIFNEDLESEDDFAEENNKIKTQFLNNKIFLIADLDNEGAKKHALLKEMESDNFQYYPLPVREIENILSVSQLKTAIPFTFTKLDPDNFKELEFNHNEYKKVYLGSFLFELLSKNKNILVPKAIKKDSGTLETRYKIRLAKAISDNIEWKEMSTEAQALTKLVVEFIEKSNYMSKS